MKETEAKQCQNCHQDFVIEQDDKEFYVRMGVSIPTFCPECREIRRIAFRNEHSLYKRKCDLCGKMVVSRVSPDKPYPMYCRECWHSDKWDAMEYGHEYDFSKPFFSQFKELLFLVPSVSILNSNMVNSDWANQETDDKNCYLNVGGHFNEDSAFNTYEFKSGNCFDNFWLMLGELCYENIVCERAYKVAFSESCDDCQDVYFSFDCRNCSNCFGCAGLRNKQYCIWNEQKTKEEYKAFMATRPFSTHEKLRAMRDKAAAIWENTPHKPLWILKSNDASGNYIINSKNVHNTWSGEEVENSKHLYITAFLKECWDASSYGWGELCYECSSSVGMYNSKMTMFGVGTGGAETMHSTNLDHCHTMNSCHNCFGCVGLKSKEYCIFNKQYTKEEYETLLLKIKRQMEEMPYVDGKGRMYGYGESFPIEISNYGYNETVAQDYYPLTRDEALVEGYPWCDYESESKYELSDYVIPEDMDEVKDDILEKVLKCEVSGKQYRLIPMELAFYRRMNFPIPRKSPLTRHKERMVHLLPRKLWHRHCACNGAKSESGVYKNTIEHFHGDKPCPNEFETSYAPEKPEIVYCEKCYQTEIY